MKNSRLIIILIPILGISFSFFGCRTFKHKSKQTEYNKEQTFSNWRIQQEDKLHYVDSSGRYWFFHSDTTFYFHPDSGLLAGRGNLSFWEQQRKAEYRSSSTDSSHNKQSVIEKYSVWEKYVKRAKESYWLWLTGIFLLLVIGVFIFKYVRRFV